MILLAPAGTPVAAPAIATRNNLRELRRSRLRIEIPSHEIRFVVVLPGMPPSGLFPLSRFPVAACQIRTPCESIPPMSGFP